MCLLIWFIASMRNFSFSLADVRLHRFVYLFSMFTLHHTEKLIKQGLATLGQILIFLCVAMPHGVAQPVTEPVVIIEASYYVDNREGTITASGETYNQFDLVASSDSFPIHTILLLREPVSGVQVRVRVNDRPSRLDARLMLSLIAAMRLGITGQLLTPLEVQPLGVVPPQPSTEIKVQQEEIARVVEKIDLSLLRKLREEEVFRPVGTYTMEGEKVSPAGFGVQVAGLSELQPALEIARKLESLNFQQVFLQCGWEKGKKSYRVLVGAYPTEAAAAPLKQMLGKTYPGAFTRAHF